MQNAEELLDDPKVLDSIDGIAKEDLFFGVDKPETPNEPEDVAFSLKQLRMARDAGRKVLVVEYLSDPAKIAAAGKQIVDEGFLPYFAPRLLDCLNPPAVPLPHRDISPVSLPLGLIPPVTWHDDANCALSRRLSSQGRARPCRRLACRPSRCRRRTLSISRRSYDV